MTMEKFLEFAAGVIAIRVLMYAHPVQRSHSVDLFLALQGKLWAS
jgi:hypothetical protein